MSEDPYNPDYEYIAYIDESGETGLRKVLGLDGHGSSEWFVLSFVIVPKAEEPNITGWIKDMIAATGSHQLRDLHFAKLPDKHKEHVTNYMA